LVLSYNKFHLHNLLFACKFIVVNPSIITCDNPLQESLFLLLLFFFMVSLQILHAHFHTCPFVLICKLLWHPPCTNFVIPGICTADVQLAGYITDSNLSLSS
jgi:hypothetical protein